MIELLIILVLIILIIALGLYNFKIYKQLNSFKNTNQKINSLNVLQDFMNITGDDMPVNVKIDKINDTLINKFNIKYSTIVIFNGAEYEIKASNVDEKHWNSLKNLHSEEMFKESVTSYIPKYVTIENSNERLPYQKTELGRAKSAVFFPLYIDNVYIGYWIIESGEIHAFDNIDMTIFSVVRENIVDVLKSISYQSTIENIYRKDKFSDLNSAEYLYGIGKKKIDKFTSSVICMFKIINLEEINKKYNREIGNNSVIDVSNIIKKSIASDYIFVRYMGPKFVIAFSGVEVDSVINFLKGLKREVEKHTIGESLDTTEKEDVEEKVVKKKSAKRTKELPKAKLNFVISTYYKGTSMDTLIKKLEDYLDNAEENEAIINQI